MGKDSDNIMDGREPRQSEVHHIQEETRQQSNTNFNDAEETTSPCLFTATNSATNGTPTSPRQTSHLVASTSSPSLLAGCANSNTHAGADIERHIHAHNVHIAISPRCPLSPIPVSPDNIDQAAPFSFMQVPPSPSSGIPSDSVFITPSPSPQHRVCERPRSMPTNYFEKISGTLLRLIGDHYLCNTCGRQLRTIGDQLVMEANINQIRRAFSASDLDANNDKN